MFFSLSLFPLVRAGPGGWRGAWRAPAAREGARRCAAALSGYLVSSRSPARLVTLFGRRPAGEV